MPFNQTVPGSSANFSAYNDISGAQNKVSNTTYNSGVFY